MIIKDQLNNNVNLTGIPRRIVSLVPSQTELLYDLGLDEDVVGITKFCVHPASWLNTKARIGGTKNLNINLIRSLQPDLIIANKEENIKEQILALAAFAPVWVSDIHSLKSALDMINQVGKITGTAEKASQLTQKIRTGFQELDELVRQLQSVPTAYFIWKDPYMSIGGDTFINHMLDRCGLQNICSNQTRYPEITIKQIREGGCRLLLLSSEPYPFKQKHIDELNGLLPETKIMLVDGEMFSWYGSRMQYAPMYFRQLLQTLQP